MSLKQFVAATLLLVVSVGTGLAADGGETNSALVGSCVVTASYPRAFIDMMPRLGRATKQRPVTGLIVLKFDNTKGDALTLSVSGALLDAKDRRYDVAWLDRETSKPWDGRIGKGKNKTMTFLAPLAKHNLKGGDSVKMVVVVKDEAGHKAELTLAAGRIIGAM